MVYDLRRPTIRCTVCESEANGVHQEFGTWEIVDCARCGDFEVSHVTADDVPLPIKEPKLRALASHLIRRMQAPRTRPKLTEEFFASLRTRALPSPAEASDNLVIWIAEQQDGRPGRMIEIAYANPTLLGTIGVVGPEDISWIVDNLVLEGRLDRGSSGIDRYQGYLTPSGWAKFEELKLAHVSSRYAFFARKFDNPDLDRAFDLCLRPAVEQTGYELRTVTQRAGLVDAVIEDEIRRCRFLIADLSDDNAGAYWEAGFGEGLGKPVIYVCRAKEGDAEKKTHFDANHRHTVRWDLASLDQTATKLKAVIRNTLLGEANQVD